VSEKGRGRGIRCEQETDQKYVNEFEVGRGNERRKTAKTLQPRKMEKGGTERPRIIKEEGEYALIWWPRRIGEEKTKRQLSPRGCEGGCNMTTNGAEPILARIRVENEGDLRREEG